MTIAGGGAIRFRSLLHYSNGRRDTRLGQHLFSLHPRGRGFRVAIITMNIRTSTSASRSRTTTSSISDSDIGLNSSMSVRGRSNSIAVSRIDRSIVSATVSGICSTGG